MAKFFIDRPIFAWVIALFIVVIGALAMTKLPIAQYPKVAPPAIIINTAYPGASAQVLEDMRSWLSRPLDQVYPVILIDAIFLKVRSGTVANRPCYVAMGVNLDGQRDVLGLWMGPSGGEGAKQWMNMLTELKNRGIVDVCIVCCDGLKGLPAAIEAMARRFSSSTGPARSKRA